MPDYTPTTDWVCISWMKARDGEVTVAEAHGEFSRWLAQHDRELSKRCWSEGFNAGFGIATGDGTQPGYYSNPYRSQNSTDNGMVQPVKTVAQEIHVYPGGAAVNLEADSRYIVTVHLNDKAGADDGE